MKVVILCGGKGTRMRGVTDEWSNPFALPKPLSMINGRPMIWHIMNHYSHYGFNDFILLTGYMGDKIKEYFVNFAWKNFDFVLNLGQVDQPIQLLQKPDNWRITFCDTGADTMTGGRVKRIESLIQEDTFLLTYGDGLADVDIVALINFHEQKGKLATLTGIQKRSPFGMMTVKDDIIQSFEEKPNLSGLINGGYFVLNKKVFDYIDNRDSCIFEQDTLVRLTQDKELAVYPHNGFWAAVDTFKDLIEINENWDTIQKKLYGID